MSSAKEALHALARDAACADCGSPRPQWASLSFAVFLCLQCAGVHRGFGVHISFVRSLSMDAWHPDQLRRMQLGGNAPFVDFLRAYSPPEHGGYAVGMDTHALYHSWAATQYREKLDYALAGKPWAPSSPPPAPPSPHPLRKSRASPRTPQKSPNEAFLASLGQANAARPTDLPPSQGGRYQGFGNTPVQHPLSSAAAPSLADLHDNPAAAFSKGWSLFSAAVAGASRVVNENVLQPGMDRVMDPNLHASVRGYVSEAHRRAQLAGQSMNEWSKTQLGVDVADHVTGVVGAVRDKDESEYDDTDHFFHEYSHAEPTTANSVASQPGSANAKKEDWDEWQDF